MRTNPIRFTLIAALVGFPFALLATRADDPPPIAKKDIETSKNNLKQIALAFMDYHDQKFRIASNIYSIDDKRLLLSWRVAILPYLGKEEAKLYSQFNLDEPWNSDNNRKLVEKMPKLFEPVRVKAKAGETF